MTQIIVALLAATCGGGFGFMIGDSARAAVSERRSRPRRRTVTVSTAANDVDAVHGIARRLNGGWH